MINKRNFLIKESLKRKLLSKWFLIINIIIFILIFISFHIDTIITFFGGDFKEEKQVLVIDKVGIYNDFKKDFLRISEFAVTKYSIENTNITIDELKYKINNNSNIIGIEILPNSNNYLEANLYSLKGISTINRNIISSSINNIKKQVALNSFNISNDKMNIIEKQVDINSIVLSEKQVNENKDVSSAVLVIIFIVPSFFLITTLVQMIGSEINEEKTTKSMEIIVSNVSPKDHLLSKIISCFIFTIIQVSLLALFIFISSITHTNNIGTLSSSSTNTFATGIISDLITPDFIKLVINISPILIISFITTIITYALLSGIMASMTTNIDDFQQLQTPVMLIISLSLYLALMSALFEGSIFIKIMSFIPLISFMVSPTLYILGQISLLSVFISTSIQILFLFIVYHYGIKIYKVGILNYSGEHLWKKIIKALKTN